jgi:hypothetical protein
MVLQHVVSALNVKWSIMAFNVIACQGLLGTPSLVAVSLLCDVIHSVLVIKQLATALPNVRIHKIVHVVKFVIKAYALQNVPPLNPVNL